jgi:hypothetical protein
VQAQSQPEEDEYTRRLPVEVGLGCDRWAWRFQWINWKVDRSLKKE